MVGGIRGNLAVVAVGLVAPLLALAAFFLEAWGQFPMTVAVHWDGAGVANAFTTRTTRVWLMPVILTTGMWGLLTIALATVPPWARGARWLRSVPAGAAWCATTVSIALLLPQRGLADAMDAPFSLTWYLAGLVAALVGTWLAAFVSPESPPPTVFDVELARAEQAADSTAFRWRGLAGPGAATYVLIMLLGLSAVGAVVALRPVLALLLLAALVVVAAFTSLRVVVTDRVLRVRGRMLGVPRVVVDLASVTGVDVVEVRTLPWRLGSRSPDGCRVLATRRGPGLRLELVDDSSFVVTVADAEAAADVIKGLIASRHG